MGKRSAKRAAAKGSGAGAGREAFEALKARHKALHDRRVAAQASLDAANRALERLKEKARREYGTDDIEKLRTKLAEMKAENDRRALEYEKHLGEIEAGLARVEEEHGLAEEGK